MYVVVQRNTESRLTFCSYVIRPGHIFPLYLRKLNPKICSFIEQKPNWEQRFNKNRRVHFEINRNQCKLYSVYKKLSPNKLSFCGKSEIFQKTRKVNFLTKMRFNHSMSNGRTSVPSVSISVDQTNIAKGGGLDILRVVRPAWTSSEIKSKVCKSSFALRYWRLRFCLNFAHKLFAYYTTLWNLIWAKNLVLSLDKNAKHQMYKSCIMHT